MPVETRIKNPLNTDDPFILDWTHNESVACPSCKHQGMWAMGRLNGKDVEPDDEILRELDNDIGLLDESKAIYYICAFCKNAFEIRPIITTRHMGPVFKKLAKEENKINKQPKAIRKPKIRNAVDRMEV